MCRVGGRCLAARLKLQWVSLTHQQRDLQFFLLWPSVLVSANRGDTNTLPARRWSARTIDSCVVPSLFCWIPSIHTARRFNSRHDNRVGISSRVRSPILPRREIAASIGSHGSFSDDRPAHSHVRKGSFRFVCAPVVGTVSSGANLSALVGSPREADLQSHATLEAGVRR